MTSREYFRQTRTLRSSVSQKKRQLRELYRVSEKAVAALPLDCQQAELSQKKIINALSELKRLQQELILDSGMLAKLETEIRGCLGQIDDDACRTFIELYYLDMNTMETVAEKTSYSPRHLQRIHTKALLAMESVINVS